MIYRRCHNASCASQLKASLLWSPSDFWFFWYFSYRLNFRNPPSGTWSHEILGGVGEIQDIQVSHYIWPLCYSYHMLPYVIIIIFDLLLYFAIFYLCYQYCSKVFDPPPNWADLETIGRLFFRNGFPPVSAVLDVHPRGYQLAIICTHIRHNALHNL